MQKKQTANDSPSAWMSLLQNEIGGNSVYKLSLKVVVCLEILFKFGFQIHERQSAL